MNTLTNKLRLQYDENSNPELIIGITKADLSEVSELKQIISNSKQLAVEIKQYRAKRSLDANSLLWRMCTEIAAVIRSSKDDVYLQMLERYGLFTHIVVKQEAVDRISKEWRTVRVLGEVTINGKTGIQMQCYYGSHLLDTKEFSVLLDGVISEAKELGISTMTPDEINLLKQEWGR